MCNEIDIRQKHILPLSQDLQIFSPKPKETGPKKSYRKED